MKDFIEPKLEELLISKGFNSYEDLWGLKIPAVDMPNRERGGWSSVSYLELDDKEGVTHKFFIKRQINHLTRTIAAPFGEPTFAREFRNIQRYEMNAVPALEAVYYAEKKTKQGYSAILITRSLDSYRPLDELIMGWHNFENDIKHAILKASGLLVGRLHSARLCHRCLYPKHIFINLDNEEPARLIDLEKSRYQLRKKRDSVSDLNALLRRVSWNEAEKEILLSSYLRENPLGLTLAELNKRFSALQKSKDARRK